MTESNSGAEKKSIFALPNHSNSAKKKLDVNWKVFWIGALSLLVLVLIFGLISKALLKSNVIPVATILLCGIFLCSIFINKFTKIQNKIIKNSFSFSLGWIAIFSLIKFFLR